MGWEHGVELTENVVEVANIREESYTHKGSHACAASCQLIFFLSSQNLYFTRWGLSGFTYKIPRLRMRMTVILACFDILTFHSMGMGSSA